MIYFANVSEIDEIMKFIDDEWKKNHILARNKNFFEYMYVLEDKVNFVVSRERKSDKINGILGFIPYDKAFSQISLAVWKALNSSEGMIGIGMLKFLLDEIKPKVVVTPGINPGTTIPIYKFLKFQTGKMDHFYRLADRNQYNIAVVNEKEWINVPTEGKIIKISSFDDYKGLQVEFEQKALHKEDWYIKKRYFEHPMYNYQISAIVEEHDVLVVVAREQIVGDSKCLRIVDLLGNYDLFSKCTGYFDEEMKRNGYEYVDCYVAGISEEVFALAGWQNCENSSNIIPNYFAPFERTNVDIYFSSKPQGIVILRGDGDQDRPN